MERPWREVMAALDQQTGRRFPPLAGRGRGYRLDIDHQQMSRAELVACIEAEARAAIERDFVFIGGVGFPRA